MNYALKTLIDKQKEIQSRINTSEKFIEGFTGYVDGNHIELYHEDLENLKKKFDDLTIAINVLEKMPV